jgi:hypothetical protein
MQCGGIGIYGWSIQDNGGGSDILDGFKAYCLQGAYRTRRCISVKQVVLERLMTTYLYLHATSLFVKACASKGRIDENVL